MTYGVWPMPLAFTDGQVTFLLISSDIIVTLSILALSVFFISVYLTPKQEITFSLKLICNLFFSDLIYAVSNILSNFSSKSVPICQVEGFMKNYALYCSFSWAYIIAYVAYNQTVENTIDLKERYRRYCIIAYGAPTIISIVPLIPNPIFGYGSNQIFCWVVGTEDEVLVRWLIFLIWVWLIIFATTVLYIRLYLYLKRLNIGNQVFQYRAILVYPVILYICLIPATLHDTGLFNNDPFPLMIAHIVMLHSMGLLNCIAFGLQKILAITRRNRALIESQESFAPAARKSQSDTQSLTDLELADEMGISRKHMGMYKSPNDSLTIVLRQSPL